jgi:hypothetical protein
MRGKRPFDPHITLLVHLGYLSYDQEAETVYIPNEEVRREFIRAIKHGRHYDEKSKKHTCRIETWEM